MKTTKIQDFGVKIGGARKDLRQEVAFEEICSMSQKEKLETITKNKIWKKPNYVKMDGEDCIPIDVVYYIKKVRDSIPSRPKIEEWDSPQKIDLIYQEYIEFVSYVRDSLMEVKTQKEARSFYVKKIKPRFVTQEKGNLVSVKPTTRRFFTNKFLRTVQIDENEWNMLYFEIIDKKFLCGIKSGKSSKPRKGKFVPKQLEHIVRDGTDYRKGRNAKGEDYIEVFGFKGGEFGVWMSENDRQYSLNYGFDALMDLADALDIDPKDISLDGQLSIAFGARGHGSALAHYEPVKEVINLTKKRGAGSLAHEWAHALDDFIARNELTEMWKKSPMATENLSKLGDLDSLKVLMRKIRYREGGCFYTDFYEGSQAFDKSVSKTSQGYWASNCEMFARAFACYVMDKLDNRSDYLVGHANAIEKEVIDADGEVDMIYAYPIGEERKVINECFDELIKELKQKGLLHERKREKK